MSNSVSFLISNNWTTTSSVELSMLASDYSQASQTASIFGRYRNVHHVSYDEIILGRDDVLENISIDGECLVQGNKEKVANVLDKVQRAIAQNTGNATLTGKDLTIITGQT